MSGKELEARGRVVEGEVCPLPEHLRGEVERPAPRVTAPMDWWDLQQQAQTSTTGASFGLGGIFGGIFGGLFR